MALYLFLLKRISEVLFYKAMSNQVMPNILKKKHSGKSPEFK